VTTQNKRFRRPRWHISQFKVEEAEGKVRFHDLFLPIALMRAIQEVGYEYASPIQAMTLPYALAGYDCIGKAQTGTGKTAAFLITVITDLLEHRLEEQYSGEPRSLILAPTRELALQIAEDATALTKFSRLKVVSAVGGMDLEKQQKQLAEQRCDILVATPGRLIDLMNRKSVFLDQIELLVIDEADRMLDMGFIPDIKTIVRAAPRNENRQTLMFSATFSPDILNLVDRWTNDPVRVEVEPKIKTSDDVEQHVYLVSADEKYQVLKRIVSEEEADRVMVFANRRDIVRELSEKLKSDGINCQVLSGEVPQNKRIRTLDGFKEGKFSVLVATDVAGRGIHIDGVSHVVNYTLPEDAEDYVHRIGRTGRAGKKGVSISFACEDDSFQIPAIEEYIKAKISVEQIPAAWVSDEAFIDAIAQRKLDAETADTDADAANEAAEEVSADVVVATETTEIPAVEAVEEDDVDVGLVGEVSSIEIAETEDGPEIEVEITVVEDEVETKTEAEQVELALDNAETTDETAEEPKNS
jgi:ATP-dependent RNA helicase RhlB